MSCPRVTRSMCDRRSTRSTAVFGRVSKPIPRRRASQKKTSSIGKCSHRVLCAAPQPLYEEHMPEEHTLQVQPVLPTSPISSQEDVEHSTAQLPPTNISPTNISPTNISPTDISPTDISLTGSSCADTTNLTLGFEPTGPLVGREWEYEHLTELISTAVSPHNQSKSIYVCGTPGTGKTFSVSRVAKRLRTRTSGIDDADTNNPVEDDIEVTDGRTQSPQTIWVNCATLSQPRDLYSHLASELHIPTSSACANPAHDAIRSFATSSGPKVLIVLDEVDFLTSADQMVLYAAFEWPKLSNSRIVLVGIANAIDLPVRLLPWLRASGRMPEIVPFAPYDSASLSAIVQQRLGQETTEAGLLSDKAISLATKKVAAGSGDARLVLDVCREAVMEMSRDMSRNSIMVVSSILNRRGGLSTVVDTIKRLPVQQQLALCVAANATVLSSPGGIDTQSSKLKSQLNRKATLGGLFDSFVRMCSRARVSCVSFSDFADICCNSLAHHGLLDVPNMLSRKGKNSARTLRTKAVRLRVPMDDVRAGVADRGFLPLLVAK